MPLAKASRSRLCGTFLYLIERPIRKSSPLPTSTNGISLSVWELPLPSSLVQTISVLSSRLPLPPGSGVSASRFGQIGHLLAVPFVDLGQFLLRLLVAVRVVRQLVVAFADPEPAHPGLADRIGELQRRDPGEVGGEAVDHEVDLHLADLGHVARFVLHARFELGNGVPDVAGCGCPEAPAPSRARRSRALPAVAGPRS